MNHDARILRRYGECVAFVLLWMAGEHYFHLSPLTSQLLGIPYIALFQIAVARRPLAQLWVRDAASFRIDRGTLAVAGALALASAALLWLGSGEPAAGLNDRTGLFWLVLAATVPAAMAWRAQRASALRAALPTMVAAMVFRVVWHVVWQVDDGVVMFPPAKLLDFFTLWVCEFVALFLVDEVAFRGALDPHLLGASSGRLHEWCSAVFVSILWAIWHLPAYNPHAKGFLALFSRLAPFYIGVLVMGVLLSFCARKARTLVPSSIMHAFGNAYVLALMK